MFYLSPYTSEIRERGFRMSALIDDIIRNRDGYSFAFGTSKDNSRTGGDRSNLKW